MPRAGRLCPKPGCPALIAPGERACPTHRREHEQQRGTRQQRGYDTQHDTERRRWAPRVAAGEVDCWRCGHRIHPDDAWDLGHDDHDRTVHRGPEHAGPCNRAAGGRAAHQGWG